MTKEITIKVSTVALIISFFALVMGIVIYQMPAEKDISLGLFIGFIVMLIVAIAMRDIERQREIR